MILYLFEILVQGLGLKSLNRRNIKKKKIKISSLGVLFSGFDVVVVNYILIVMVV